MKTKFITIVTAAFFIGSFSVAAQDDSQAIGSNIQTYTPSKLLNKGQWDIKFFNGLYTQTKADDKGKTVDVERSNFFTSTVEVFTGISDNNRFNVGAIVEFRSNTFGGRKALSVFKFDGRSGISTIAPAVKFQPLKNVSNFSIQSAIHIPTHSEESNEDGFLDQTAWAFQNRFFYDYTFPSNKWQLFTELNTEYNFGDEESFADKTFIVAPGVFLSYFPSDKSTVLAFAQHSQRFGDFTQDYTALGFGGKYQLTPVLNLEVLYSNFVRGKDNGLGQSFNIGLRALF